MTNIEEKKQIDGKWWSDNKTIYNKLVEYFPTLSLDFTNYIKNSYNFKEKYINRLTRMLKYTCIGGKMNRAILTVTTVVELSKKNNIKVDSDEFKKLLTKSLVLGWCIEILQAFFLVADDIMDASTTRRGQPCWYKNDDVQLDGINDSFILESFIYYLLKHNIKDDTLGLNNYIMLFELYHEVTLQTEMGQMLDLLSQPQGKKGPEVLKGFNEDLYFKIIRYKTAFYSFYLPVASGMIICGYNKDSQLNKAKKLSIELGEKFQIQDDYLDCFGDYDLMGKIGTDIQDHKCSWLMVKALGLVNDQQLNIIKEHYGKEEKEDVDAIRKLYDDLKLEALYEKQEESSFKAINGSIEASSLDEIPVQTFKNILNKIHKRQK